MRWCRNNFLQDKGVNLPKATSTGTTIVGCIFKDGVVLGADTRATNGDIVADKNCEKVRAPNSQLMLVSNHTLRCYYLDSLHHREHPLLRGGYSSRHRVHNRDDFKQHRTARTPDGADPARRHGDDDAQAVFIPIPGLR